MSELKQQIEDALKQFSTGAPRNCARKLLNVLGYDSDKTDDIEPNTFQGFKDYFLSGQNPFNEQSAKADEWQSIDIIFQLTDEDLKRQNGLFSVGKVDYRIIESYLFLVIQLKGSSYSRTDLARITREINKLTPMPSMLFFRYGDILTIATIDRRLHKRDESRDVLDKKVTLIKDISVTEPIRAHIEILHDLALPSLVLRHKVDTFVALHNAWRKTLDISALNRKFYKELFNWYLYAVKSVTFPNPDKLSDEVNNSINVIRLLTRLIFCWFIKEKGLISWKLFNQGHLQGILSERAAADPSAFYKAILQNLFFATLNTEMNRDTTGSRRFISEEKINGVNPDYNNFTVYRHKNLFKDPVAALKLFEDIPFLNGGLFECLDTVEAGEGKNQETRYDGFSTKTSKQPMVPDVLFFGEIKDVDLSKEFGGGTSGKHETVTGLIDILNSYKFTIAENTPLEEEVALDPELLGKVFENLLASYNPETRSTARNQTGSFYTPREIVNYMVDESLKAYLGGKLDSVGAIPCVRPPLVDNGKHGGNSDKGDHKDTPLQEKLSILFSHADSGNPFADDEELTDHLIKAISNARILDPACGSGAFPMGVLHRMVHILGKLDPNNRKWKQAQLAIVEEDRQKALEMRDEAVREGALKSVEERLTYIEASFDSSHHELDYLRKLFLIENCIYGVDIQNIAVQIAKLRFFISLIVEQKKDPTRPNLGILAMPNLETKFVAADSLIALERPQQLDLGSHVVEKAEFELRQVRERVFYARKYRDKKELRKQEKVKREALEKALVGSNWGKATAHQVAAWNPFDVSSSAPFFDPEMMFGMSDGFNIVIGNPPYIQIQSFSGQPVQKAWESQNYETYAKTGDVYCLFYERGFNLLAPNGVLTYITSNKWMRAGYGKAMRKFFMEQGRIGQLIDFGDSPIFENATTYTNILVLHNSINKLSTQVWDLSKAFAADTCLEIMLEKQGVGEPIFNEDSFVIASGGQTVIKKRIEEVGVSLKKWDISIYRGILTGLNEAFIITEKKKAELIGKDQKNAEIIKPILRGRDIKRYKTEFADLWMITTFPALHLDINNYPAVRDYLLTFGKKLEQSGEPGCRKKTSNKWFEVQDTIAYHSEIEKEKIVFAEIVFDSAFFYDIKGYSPEATSFLMTGERLKYLTALLNSTLLTYAFKTFYAGGDLRGDTFRYKKVFLENLPIPKISTSAQLPYECLVDCILFAHDKGLSNEASTFEWVINVMVYGLYFEAEMKKADCYISDRVAEVVKPFKAGDTDDFKTEYVQKLNDFFLKDKIIYHGLVHSRNIGPVEIIHETRKK